MLKMLLFFALPGLDHPAADHAMPILIHMAFWLFHFVSSIIKLVCHSVGQKYLPRYFGTWWYMMVHEHPKPSSLCLFLDVFGIFIRVSPLSTSTSASAEPRFFFHLSPTVGEPNSADHRLSSIATWCWELELSTVEVLDPIGHWYAHALSKAESRLNQG